VPGRRLVWSVLDSDLSFVENRTEWTGTTVTFDLARKGAKTEVRFTHVGLVPGCACYDACSKGWSFYLNESLRPLVTGGRQASAGSRPRAGRSA
jgi:hypothetical protein